MEILFFFVFFFLPQDTLFTADILAFSMSNINDDGCILFRSLGSRALVLCMPNQ